MSLNHLGECCNQVNIQSEGPAAVHQDIIMGDYKRYGNDRIVYKNIVDSTGEYLYKDVDGDWVVCTNCQYRLLLNLVILLTNFPFNIYGNMYCT